MTLAAHIQHCTCWWQEIAKASQCSFHLLICGWNAIWYFSHPFTREGRLRKHLYGRIGTPIVSSNLGTPLPSSPAPCVGECLPVSMRVWTGPPSSALLAPCSVLPPREGSSHLFEVSLQLRGLTPQVSPWLFTQSWCNSAGKPCLCHEYKARHHPNGVNFTSTLILFCYIMFGKLHLTEFTCCFWKEI